MMVGKFDSDDAKWGASERRVGRAVRIVFQGEESWMWYDSVIVC
jgi:hypothetical protein